LACSGPDSCGTWESVQGTGSWRAWRSPSRRVSVSGDRANLSAVAYTTNVATESTTSRSFTYYDTGNVKVATDVNQGQTHPDLRSLRQFFPTTVTPPISPLATSMTWDCTGAVVTSTTDAPHTIGPDRDILVPGPPPADRVAGACSLAD